MSMFEVLRQEDASGEFWSARDFTPYFGYSSWKTFRAAVRRAEWWMSFSGNSTWEHFTWIRGDVRLSRQGAENLCMYAGDSKPESFRIMCEVRDAAADPGLPFRERFRRLNRIGMTCILQDELDGVYGPKGWSGPSPSTDPVKVGD